MRMCHHNILFVTTRNLAASTATVVDILGPWCSRIQFNHDLFGPIVV